MDKYRTGVKTLVPTKQTEIKHLPIVLVCGTRHRSIPSGIRRSNCCRDPYSTYVPSTGWESTDPPTNNIDFPTTFFKLLSYVSNEVISYRKYA